MSYVAPSIGPAGLTIPSYTDILNDLVAQYGNVYGQSAYLALDSADYQWISVVAAKLADTMQAVLYAYQSRAPLTAVGAALDGIVKVNGLARKPASASTCAVTITGTAGTVITNGIVKDIAGYLWNLPAAVTIPLTGTVTVTAICQTLGSLAPAIGDLSAIATPQAGWTSVTNLSTAFVGLPTETDAQLRARQSLSVATPSRTMLGGTIAGISATAGVGRWNVVENPTNATDANGTPAHSISCIVEGGAEADVATAIYNNRGIGCYTNGTTTVNVTDAFTGGVTPIRFSRPTHVPVYVSISVQGLTGYTTATATAIQAALVTYLNSLQIGQSVVLSELYGAALSVRPNGASPQYSIRSLTLGTSANPTGTADVAMSYAQVSQGVSANVVLTQL